MPPEVHALRGDAGKRNASAKRAASAQAETKREEEAAAAQAKASESVDPPDWLVDPAAVEEWRRIAPDLARVRLLRETDRVALATYCQAVARYRSAQALIATKGMTYTTETKHGTMERIRPEVKILQDAERTMRSFMTEFGITPSSRTRINAALANSNQLPLPLPPPGGGQAPTAVPDAPKSPLGYLN